jgi:transposase
VLDSDHKDEPLSLCKFLEIISNIKEPFFVNDVRIDDANFKIYIHVSYDSDRTFNCTCGHGKLPICGTEHRMWRDLNDKFFHSYLIMDVPMVQCPKCNKIQAIEIPWARPKATTTLSFESKVLFLAKAMPLEVASKHLDLPVKKILSIVNYYQKKSKKGLVLK